MLNVPFPLKFEMGLINEMLALSLGLSDTLSDALPSL